MLIAVTTSSQSLYDILKTEQKEWALDAKERRDGFQVFIQNLDASNNIYIDIANDADVSTGVKIAADGGTLSLVDRDLSSIYLVADSANSNVRVLVN